MSVCKCYNENSENDKWGLTMKKKKKKTIHSQTIFKGKVISLKVDDVTLPNGETSKREIVNHPGAVAIIAITGEGKLVVVEQYRKALERSIIEIPAGKLEPGELPEITAARELEEETGYGCNELTYLQSFATSPGFADEIIHLFIARGLYKIENQAAMDEDEFVELMEITVEEGERMIAQQKIFDAKTAFAILWMKMQG